jgi:predicted nucleic acid-binding protein
MSDKFFLDTNVFVYAFDPSASAKARQADDLIRLALNSGRGVISYQVVQEFFNVAYRRFPEPMRGELAEVYFLDVLGPLCAVQSSAELFVQSLRAFGRYRMQWFDALIVAGAIEAKCSILYSEDFQHGQKFEGVEIRNPFL